MKNIDIIYKKYGIKKTDVQNLGDFFAKLKLQAIEKKEIDNKKIDRKPTLILVTAVSPTESGEGKTTVSIGLTQALNKIKVKTIAALREPSLGPVFGMKGGATGGGLSQILPSDSINLHFTGDLHAITSANNLISAALDNHIYFGNALKIKKESIVFKRCLDMNDRTLRDSFDITAASEMMAIFCLAKDYDDLRLRVDSILLAKNTKGKNIYVKDLKVTGAVIALLRDAMLPNLVQTTSGALAVVHGGPFANIAHGCNSVLATRAAMAYSDICVTEAGFGADLGAVKFLDIKMRSLNEGKKKGEYIWPKFIVIVATVKSGRLQGTGFDNLKKHIENMSKFGSEVVVAVNRFKDDGEEELKNILETVALCGARGFITDFYAKGENGGDDIARYIKNSLSQDTLLKTKYLYKDEDSIKEKIEKVAKEIFGAKKVELSKEVKKKILEIEKSGFYHLPICIAKNQYSFTGDAKLLGAPTGHTLHISDITLRSGAGFITVFAGTIYTMPGLSRSPAAENIDINKSGCVINLK